MTLSKQKTWRTPVLYSGESPASLFFFFGWNHTYGLMGPWNPVNSPVEVGSLSHYLQGFIHHGWLFGISAINSSTGFNPRFLRKSPHLHPPWLWPGSENFRSASCYPFKIPCWKQENYMISKFRKEQTILFKFQSLSSGVRTLDGRNSCSWGMMVMPTFIHLCWKAGFLNHQEIIWKNPMAQFLSCWVWEISKRNRRCCLLFIQVKCLFYLDHFRKVCNPGCWQDAQKGQVH